MAKKKTPSHKKTVKRKPANGKRKKPESKPKATVAQKAKGNKVKTARAKMDARATVKSAASKKAVEYRRAKRALDKYGDELRSLGNRVTGISIGPRFKNDKLMRKVVIRLHVSTNEDKSWLKDNAENIGYRPDYDGVDTDIVVWSFKTLANGADIEDGTCIVGDGGRGTLGTTVIIDIDNEPTAVWITAAHVASRALTPPSNPVSISRCGGGAIGTVSKDNYFRDRDVDVAIIVPDPALDAPLPSFRTIVTLTSADRDADVTMTGATTQKSKGKIVSTDFDGSIQSPAGAEEVKDHFHVMARSGNFAGPGDSGALVFLGKKLVGMMRAMDENVGIAVVTRMDIVQLKAKEFIL